LLAIVNCMISGKHWLTQIGPAGFLHLSIMLLPTLGATFRWGRISGAVTFVLMTFLTWCLWGPSLYWFSELICVAIGIDLCSKWKWNWFRFVETLRSDGRLGWQRSAVGSHPVLWHNGMVGGSASFLGIVQELGIGVVVLTNTAKSVDAIGVKILSE